MKKIASLLLLFIFFCSGFAQELQKLTVITYNIHHGQGIDNKIDISRIANIIKLNSVDLAAFQEVDRGVERTSRIDIMKILQDSTGMFAAFGKNIDFQGGDYGNGILSKFPIVKDTNLHYKMMKEDEQRGLLQTVINLNGQKIVFMDTHPGFRNENDEKLMNVEEIINTVKEYKNLPVVICGDFNDLPESKMHEKMKDYFIDVWEYLYKDEGFTFPSDKPDRRIDYIYISKSALEKIKPVSIKVLQSIASDHLPVIAEFEIR